MSDLEWKKDPSKLSMLKDGESAIVGEWKLHVDYMPPTSEFITEITLAALSEEQREEKLRRMEQSRSHPYLWRVDREDDGSNVQFTSLLGHAKTVGQAKRLAELAVEYAGMVSSALNADMEESVDWFGEK